MDKHTIFESSEIKYQEMDGLLYPILPVYEEKSLKLDVEKYGRLWIEHMKATYPQRYRSLVRFGELEHRASQVNETSYELLEDIEKGWLRTHRPKNPYCFMEQLCLRNQARAIAEEMVLQDVVRQFH